MKNLIILFVLSLFAFSNNAKAYAIIDVTPPVEKTAKSKKYKKRFFKKKSKRIKAEQENVKESTLFSILGLIFSVSALTQVIIGAITGYTALGVILLVLTLIIALIFLLFTFVALAKEKRAANKEQ